MMLMFHVGVGHIVHASHAEEVDVGSAAKFLLVPQTTRHRASRAVSLLTS